MRQYAEGTHEYSYEPLRKTAVIKVEIREISGKKSVYWPRGRCGISGGQRNTGLCTARTDEREAGDLSPETPPASQV